MNRNSSSDPLGPQVLGWLCLDGWWGVIVCWTRATFGSLQHPKKSKGLSLRMVDWLRIITEEREGSWSWQHPSRLVQAGGEAVITVPMTICNKIWQAREWPTPWTQSLVITLPKKGNMQQCQNYRTISLISHPSKVMLKIILNRLKPQAERIVAEEQAGLRARRSTTEIFKLRILCEKHLQHQQDL